MPCRRVRLDRADERAPIHCPEGDHAGLSTLAAPHCASGTKAARPQPKRESARFPQPMDGLPKCSAQFAERCFGVLASLRASAGRPTGKHRLHCTSIDPAVRNAAGCGPLQRLRLLARASGKYLHQPKCSACSRRKHRVCGRYIRMQCIAPLRQTQLASSTRGLTSIARRRNRHSLKQTVPGARSLFCSRQDTGRTLHAWQRIGTSGA